ncbi:MAG: hypothetical protein ABSB56_04510 [Nitrososphaerales archaeon]
MVRSGVIVLVLVVIVGAAVGATAFYYNGGSLSLAPNSKVAVNSAQLHDNEYLVVDITNTGQTATKTIQVLDACSPDYSYCRGLGASPVTFVLPPGGEYVENFTPIFSNPWISTLASIPGQTYYFKLQVTFAKGNQENVSVAAKATGTTSLYDRSNSYPFQVISTIAIEDVSSSSLTLFGNLRGGMSVGLTLSNPLSTEINASLLSQTKLSSASQHPLLSASYGSCTTSCIIISGGPSQATLATTFSTVTTGITAGVYYMVAISIADYYSGYFFWIQAQNTNT